MNNPIRKITPALFHLAWIALVLSAGGVFVAMHRNLFGPGGENIHILRGFWLWAAGFFGSTSELYPPEDIWSAENVLRPALIGLWVAYLAAMVLLRYGVVGAKIRLRTILIVTAVAGVPLLLMPFIWSSDVFDYIIYGRLPVIYGDNPYLSSAAEYPADPFYNMTCWKSLPSAYGPLWTLASIFLVAICAVVQGGPPITVLVFKSFTFACHLATGWFLWQILTRARSPVRAFATVLFLWNPLPLIESAGNGHNEALLILLVVAAVYFEQHGRWAIATVCLALATQTKLYALPVFCLYAAYRWWKEPDLQRAWRSAAASAFILVAVSVALYLPFGLTRTTILAPLSGPAALSLTKSLAEYMVFKSPVKLDVLPIVGDYFIGNRQEDVQTACKFFIFLICAGGALYARSLSRVVTAMGVFAFFWCAVGSTWFMPWYITVAIAFAALSPSPIVRWPSLLLSATVFIIYLLEGWSWGKGHNFMVAYYQVFVFVPPLSLAILIAIWNGLRGAWRIGTLRAAAPVMLAGNR